MPDLRPIVRRLEGERRAHRTGGRRFSDREPNRGWRPVLFLALSIALLDWTVKAAVYASVPLESFVEVWQGRVALWHVRNPDMMLGLWGGFPLPIRQGIAAVAALVAFFVLFQIVGRSHRLPPGRREWAWVCVGLAFGGMLGNLGERALHWSVTDYLSLRWAHLWLPPGNVADVAIFLSIPLVLPVILFELRARSRRGSGRPAHLSGPAARPLPHS